MSVAEAKHDPSESEPLPGGSALGARGRIGLVLLLLFATLLRIGVVLQFEAQHPQADAPVIDERSYVEWGARIAAEGEWLGDEVFFQEPLYPYFIGVVYSVFGEGLTTLRLLQCLLGGLTTYLLWRLGRRAFGPLEGWIAGAAFAVHPPALLLPCLLLKPNLFLPIFAGFLLLLLGNVDRAAQAGGDAGTRYRWLGGGVLGGLAALLRGNQLILLPVFALWPLLRGGLRGLSSSWRASFAFLVGVGLVLVPVMMRNGYVGGVYALTTSGAGTNVYGGNNADNPWGVATEFDWVRGIPRYEAEDWRREAERRIGFDLDPGRVSDYWLEQVVQSMKADPGLHAGIFWNKLRLAWNGYEVPDNHHLGWDAQYVSLLRMPWPDFHLLGGLGLAGLVLCALRSRLTGPRLELALTFVAYTGTLVLTVMSMRARLPLVVALFPFTGYFVAELARSWKAGGGQRLVGPLVLGLIGIGITTAPTFDAATRAQDLADRDHNLVVSWLARGEALDEAAALAESLAQRYPRSARLQTLLADTEWRRGRRALAAGETEEGQALVRDALGRLQPVAAAEQVSRRERSRAYRVAAYIQVDLEDWPKAERFFRRAREFAGDDLELRVAHAQTLLECALLTEESQPESEQVSRQRTEAVRMLREVQRDAPGSLEARAAFTLLERLPDAQ